VSARVPGEGPILFFDGVCNLCNRSVDLLLRLARRRRLRFASLQGRTAERLIGDRVAAGAGGIPDSMVLWHAGAVAVRSTAVLRAIALMGGAWRLASVLLLVPRPLRDLAYRVVARDRYRWFGRRETCRVPAAGEAERLLD
jgi:predicted DCC family thiol-disulfide oxidoreductase YuxK